MRTCAVMSSEIDKAGGVLNAAYYLGRRDGETYKEWLERDELETWVASRIALLEKRLGKASTPLGQLRRELYLNELAVLRFRALRMREEME